MERVLVEIKLQVLEKLKMELIEATGLQNINIDNIKNNEPIFGPEGGINLDSLDALELVMLLEKNFKIKLKGKSSATVLFKNFDSLGDYIMKETPEEIIQEYISKP